MGVGRPKKCQPKGYYTHGNSFGGRGVEILVGTKSRKRLSSTVCELACKNTGTKGPHLLPGINLRPKCETDDIVTSNTASINDIIDLNKQQLSYKDAHKQHKQCSVSRKSTKHVPTLLLEKVSNHGFGTTIRYKCSRCSFVSSKYDLFDTTATGACVTNVQTGMAFSKTSIKPTEAEYLFSAMNVSCPSRQTLHYHYSQSNEVADSVLTETLVENRGFLRDYVDVVTASGSLTSEEKEDCPSVAVSLDGQYNRPCYHGFNGQATSVSEPVMEEETNTHLLVAHTIVSKKDGSYPVDKVRMCRLEVAFTFDWLSCLLFNLILLCQ